MQTSLTLDIAAFPVGPVVLAVNHPQYSEGADGTELSPAARPELLGDVRGSSPPSATTASRTLEAFQPER